MFTELPGTVLSKHFPIFPTEREARDNGGMLFANRLRVLVALFAACTFCVAQRTTGSVGLVTAALREGQFAKALQILQPELEKDPKNTQLWALRGIALSGKGDKKEALGAFRHALDISPDYLPALEGAAQIEYEDGGRDAGVLLQRVLQLQPDDQTSHAMLAVLDYRRGDCASAVTHFEKSGSLAESQWHPWDAAPLFEWKRAGNVAPHWVSPTDLEPG